MALRRGHLRVSDIVSLALNPSLLTGVFFCLLAAHYAPPHCGRIVDDALGVIFMTVIPVGLLFVLKAFGRLSDLEMSVRSERPQVYAICAVAYGLGAVLLWASGASWPLWGLSALHVPNTLALVALNNRLKVSIHTMVLMSLFIAAVMLLGRSWVLSGLLVPAAAWARWDSGNHSVRELICGMLIGGALTPIEILTLKTAFGG